MFIKMRVMPREKRLRIVYSQNITVNFFNIGGNVFAYLFIFSPLPTVNFYRRALQGIVNFIGYLKKLFADMGIDKIPVAFHAQRTQIRDEACEYSRDASAIRYGVDMHNPLAPQIKSLLQQISLLPLRHEF